MEKIPKILVVDDHKEIRISLKDFLCDQHMRVVTAKDAQQMKVEIENSIPDLIVLDVMMPGENGLAACIKLRENYNIPVIMLTALDSSSKKLQAFKVGVDDFMVKPFDPLELLARIKAILKRVGFYTEERYSKNNTSLAGKIVYFEHLTYAVDVRELSYKDGYKHFLTSGEATIFNELIERGREIVTRDELLWLLDGRKQSPYDRAVDNYISRLRRKVEVDRRHPKIILTFRNKGYSLSCDLKIC
jgi:two-component system OmpR family response regulator